MQKVIKQAVGIDCSKAELVISISAMNADFQVSVEANFSVGNDATGFTNLIKTTKKYQHPTVAPTFVVEATGVYHERLCYYLTEHGYSISVILPNRAAYFMRTLTIKTVNDKVSAAALAVMGLEKKLDTWQVPDPTLNQLRQLCRERAKLLEDTTSIKNQIHALSCSACPHPGSIKRMQKRLKISKTQVSEIEEEMETIIASDPALKQRFDNVCTIKGVGLITAIIVVAETNGFNLIRNQRQLVSYAGLDIISKQSGSSIQSSGRISHRGNAYLRKALHFPALAAIRYDDKMKERFVRLFNVQNIKMKAAVAIQRKLLILIYTLWKKNEPYDAKFLEQSKSNAGVGAV